MCSFLYKLPFEMLVTELFEKLKLFRFIAWKLGIKRVKVADGCRKCKKTDSE